MTEKHCIYVSHCRLIFVLFLATSTIAFAQQNAPQAAPQSGLQTGGQTGIQTKTNTSPTNLFQPKAGPAPSLFSDKPVSDKAVSDKPVQAPHPVSTGQAIYLVRSTLMTLNDANRSGNYTVLRDLATPDFQARNSAADLAQSFLDLRRRKFDLFSVSFADPQFNGTPSVDASGKVHLTGFFATQPLQIRFDLTFQSVDGEWKLFSISVATPEAPKEQSSLSRPASSRHLPEGLFYGVRLFSATGGWRW